MIENLEVSFTASALEDLPLRLRTIDVDFDAAPVALAAGDLDGSGVELIALGSAGGSTRLLVASRPLVSPSLRPVADELGVAPIGVAVVGSRIALANGHAAASERAEVRLLDLAGDTVELAAAYTLTASNAIAMAALPRTSQIAVAAAGRRRNDRTCTGGCDCPPDEYCAPGGVCVANDGVAVVVTINPGGPQPLTEVGRCEHPEPTCGDSDCCLDSVLGGCDIDDCGCRVPHRSRLGSWRGPLDPRGLAATSFRGTQVGLLIPTAEGLHRLEPTSTGFRDTGAFLLTPNALEMIGQDFDTGLDGNSDVLWIEDAACTHGSSIDAACPVAGEVADAAGCLGLRLTELSGFEVDLNPPEVGACRRVPLSFVPGAICVAQLDPGLAPDLVLTAPAERRVYVFAGDGKGGLLRPAPFDVAGGPLVCADFDGDGLDEIVVADESVPGRFHFLSR